MRANSIISDSDITKPEAPALQKAQRKVSDFEKVANSEEYPQFADYLKSRIDYFSQFTPGGTPVQKLTKKERSDAWDSAITIIQEFESLLRTLDSFKKKL
jgi:hypothetical protein